MLFPPPLTLRYRIPGDKYGSMLKCCDRSRTPKPSAPVTAVPVTGETTRFATSVWARQSCTFERTPLEAIGGRVPQVIRNAAFPPIDVRLSVPPPGCQLAAHAVKLAMPRPHDSRTPHVLPLP